ncbi:MAG TPA: sugar phosphate isomerase/epimerase [Candidatus Sulfotelmatobacter sp.]|nr:sugar phosphate isomerase/epimerase [Candidatus Sulfotelmatobacter sp.]
MDIGLYTDSLSELPFELALDVTAEAGVRSIEIATGGQSTAPHLDVDELLASEPARARFRDAFASRGLRLAALNCSAWPMHPVVGEAHSALIDKTLRLAAELGVSKIVSMSGCPGDGPGATTFDWMWYPWPEDAVRLRVRHWEAAVAFWAGKMPLAEASGVTRIAFELHPLHVVYNVPTLLAFRAAVGERIGANVDPSHLFWQRMEPLAAIRALGPAVQHVHMKDTEINEDQAALAGVLDDRSFVTPAERAWVFRTVGRVHPAGYWRAFIQALRDVGYDDSLSIEQEDPYTSQADGVREAAAFIGGLLEA